jgi:hypothetical protein
VSYRVITPLVVLSYPHLAVAQKSNQAGKADKFSATGIVTAETLQIAEEKAKFDAIKEGLIAAGREKWGAKFDTLVKGDGFKKGIRSDSESKNYPAGSVFLTARSVNQPGLVYSYADPTTKKPAKIAQDDIKKVLYAGAIVRLLVTIFPFEQEGNKGLSFGLEGVQFVKDGPRIDGRVAAEDAFNVDLSAAPASLDDLI